MRKILLKQLLIKSRSLGVSGFLLLKFLIARLARSDPTNDFVVQNFLCAVCILGYFVILCKIDSLNMSGHVWTRLDMSGHVWTRLDMSDMFIESFQDKSEHVYRIVSDTKCFDCINLCHMSI